MNVKQAYNIWAEQYDSNNNKTRDLEAVALRVSLANVNFDNCLEIGCGTGKNTGFLLSKCKQVTAVDFSDEMLAKAMQKINSEKVEFVTADISDEWTFATKPYDLITFSLVLEHIEDLNAIFKKVSTVIRPNGFVYIGELHPFKQYAGTKARFDTGTGQQVLTCFNHSISDFTRAAKQNDLEIVEIDEHFDDSDKANIPRIIMLVLRKIATL